MLTRIAKCVTLVLGVCVLSTPILGKEVGPQPNLVSNPGFEHWENGAPVAWNVAAGKGAEWREGKAGQSDDAPEGKTCVSLPLPSNGEMVTINQTIPADRIKRGKTAFMSMRAKATASNQLHFVVAFENRGQRVKMRRVHSGEGGWDNLSWRFEIPKTADPATFRIEIMNKEGGTEPVLIDDVIFRYEEIEAQYVLPELAHE